MATSGEAGDNQTKEIPPRIIMSNVTISDCGGTGIKSGRASLTARNLDVKRGNHGVELDDGAYAHIVNSSMNHNQGSGLRVRDSGFLLENVNLLDNEIGLDLNRGAYGDIIDSNITDNWETDIRLHRDVLVRVFDTAAKEILDLTKGDGLEEVDAHWITSRILATDDIEMKARKIKRLLNRVLPMVGIPSRTIQAAWDIAGDMIDK